MDPGHLTPHQVPGPHGAAEQAGRPAVSLADTLLAAALGYAAAGWPVFPCQPGGKRPVPLHGFRDAATDEERIRAWWGRRPCNIGVSTGAPGPDVLDVDVRPDGTGWSAFARLKRVGLLAGAHRLVRTPSGGAHLYFTGTRQRCGSLKGLFIDFKSSGGYILVPPSQVGGRPYEIIDDRPQTGAVLGWATVTALLKPPGPVSTHAGRGGSVAHLPAWLAAQGNGNRNKALFWASCRAAEAGDEAVLLALVDAAVAAGLDRGEALRTAASAARRVTDGGRA